MIKFSKTKKKFRTRRKNEKKKRKRIKKKVSTSENGRKTEAKQITGINNKRISVRERRIDRKKKIRSAKS